MCSKWPLSRYQIPTNSGDHILNTIRGEYYKDVFANDIVIWHATVLLRCQNFVFDGVKTFLWHFNLFRDFICSLPADRRNAKHGISERLSTPRKTFFPPKQVERWPYRSLSHPKMSGDMSTPSCLSVKAVCQCKYQCLGIWPVSYTHLTLPTIYSV